MNKQSIIVRHNVEMGHRLSQQPMSKCYQLHGHTWWIELEIEGVPREDGMILDFSFVKSIWRGYLDEKFDHHTVLYDADPIVRHEIEGVVTVPFDPTVENMAKMWGAWIKYRLGSQYDYYVKVWEASTNAATWRSDVTTE
jgi:6-pyruvoyltetrahydropterin/6-carboxytetrahydropterin synthase